MAVLVISGKRLRAGNQPTYYTAERNGVMEVKPETRCRERSACGDVKEDMGLGSGRPRGRGRWGTS